MMKNKKRTINISVFGSRVFDGCKTILQLGLRHSLIGVMIVSAGCNPSTTNYNQTIQQPGSSDPTKQSVQTGGPGSGGGGTGDGGGGQGVYCSETVGDSNIKGKLLVRDIYEAIKNYNRSMPSTKLGASGTEKVDENTIKYLVEILRAYFGPSSGNIDFVNAEYWKKFADNISFIPTDANLHPSQDANSALALPEGCKIVQIAYWDESSGPVEDGTLYVDKKSWKQLDQFNKMALLAHEFFFKQARRAGYKNSDFIRYKVGQLLSVEGLSMPFQAWVPSKDPRVRDSLPEKMTGFKYCKGFSDEDPAAKLQMYQYQGSDGFQHIVFPVVNSSAINFNSFDIPRIKYFADERAAAEISDILIPISHFKNRLTSLHEKKYLGIPINVSALDVRYGRNIFTSSPLNEISSNFGVFTLGILRNISRHKDVSWTLKSRFGYSKVILHNPVVLTEERKSSVEMSKEQLALEINNAIILKILGSTFNLAIQEIQAVILPSLGILNKEIEEAASAGVLPVLPKWNAEVKRIKMEISKILSQQQGKPIEYVIGDEKSILEVFPMKLYKLKINAYTQQDIMMGLKDNSKDFPVALRVGAISFVEGDNTVKFTLDCMDYTDMFREKTSNPSHSEEIDSVRLSNIKIVPEDINPEDKRAAQYLRYRSSFIKVFNANSQIYKRDFVHMGKCDSYDGLNKGFCIDLNSLFLDIRDEEEIGFKSCIDGYGTHIKSSTQELVSCGILDFKKSGYRYLVLFSYPYNEKFLREQSEDAGKLTLNYVLKIP